MAITDLTNTVWDIPAGWTCSAGYGEFSVTVKLDDDTLEYSELTIGSYLGSNDGIDWGQMPSADIIEVGLNVRRSSFQSFTITITGGTDVTNAQLISWLQENGTLVTSKAPNYTALDDALDRLAAAIAERTGAELPLTLEEMLAAAKEIGQAALISFTISGTTYQAEEGLTWEQWVGTDYNTNNKYKPGGGMPMYIEERAKLNYYIYDTTTNSCINKGNTIKANGIYSTKYVDPVGGDNN